MKKLKLYSWILLLFLLSVPAGFLMILTEDPYTPKSDYVLVLIVGTIVCTIVFGSVSLIPYFILRKRNKETALKRALQCYTFFALAAIAMGTYKYPEAMKKRDRYHFSMYFENTFRNIAMQDLETNKNQFPPSILKQQEEVSFCIVSEIQFNDKLIEELRNGKDPEDLYHNNPEIDKIKKHCIDLYEK